MTSDRPAIGAGTGARRGVARGGARSLPRHLDPPETLRGLYERYCEHEARELLALVPPEGLRALYREARRRGPAAGDPGIDDVVSAVRSVARHLLPLPPYPDWLASYLADRSRYLRRMGVPSTPDRPDPVAVELKGIGDGWYAALSVRRMGHGGWRGFIHFHRSEGVRSCRTTDIFVEEEVDAIRSRFQELSETSLRAFLASALP